ncbi:hypothetical protein PHYPO_G00156550 [Pangasianodon hypophthalmus]|uniref:Thioredoxin domain-containing protein n=1 Tax=Pangasianodon hypophthalmus TaxID=310915 RepID=A0A5N5JX11_PANHP|nr:hypothetical protein PHYPO_G00156550 [Pangasianodon hypophthalmus]
MHKCRAKSVVALARPPVRFLSPSVPVVDLFLGQQDQVEKLMEDSDVSVVFYYAPWCAHSIAAREHIQEVALRLANQVQFVAVNCWWHQGKCRKQHNFYQYPVLHVYYRRFGPINYKGPLLAEYMESFIRRVSAPLTYLPSRSALHTFLSHHEQGVVGFFDFNSSPQPPGYLTFLSSALHMLRKDPQGAVRFGVVTNREVAAGMWVTEDQSVYLHRRFNTSLDTGREALERFIVNFSAPYSPLHRHLVGASEAPPPQSLIQEVTTQSFRAVVMDTERDVLLFYYTGWCGFCTVLNHVLLRLARLFQGNSAFTVARVNVDLNDLPWEFMVDHLPTFLFFPRHRKHMSVKFPENTRVTLPNLVRFIFNHSSPSPQGKAGPKALLEAELRTLQGEVLSLQRARERLSQQLAALWRENRRLALHTQELQSHNAELQEQSTRLETLYQEKSRQLTEAVKRLQELANASEDLLDENSLLKVLLAVLREKGSTGGGTGGRSRDEDRRDEARGPGEGEEAEDGKQDVS